MKTEGSRRWSAVATNETWDTRPERPASSTVSASNPGRTTRGVPVTIARVTTARPPMCARGRQAIHDVPVGVDAEPGRCRLGRGGDGVVGEHDTLGVTRCARGRDDQRVAVLDADAVGQRMLFPVRADNPRRAQRVEQHLARDRGQPWIERSGGIAGVPNGPECIDEADATGKVECDELRHRPVA